MMSHNLHYIFIKRHSHVKPTHDGRWLVRYVNVFEEFVDDAQRYGFYVAVYNFAWFIGSFLKRSA